MIVWVSVVLRRTFCGDIEGVSLEEFSDDDFRSGCGQQKSPQTVLLRTTLIQTIILHRLRKSGGLKIRVRHVICCFKSFKLI